jgi:cellobiose phosphorylase
MSGMLPGLYENGGVYCHASAFKIVMDCRVGRPDDALRTLCKIMPDSGENPSMDSGAEPYVFTNCYSTHPKYYGKSYQSWTTGTSAWVMMGLYEGFAGLRRDLDGLHVAPCLPGAWDSLEVVRNFRGCEWHVSLMRDHSVGGSSMSIEVDGCSIEGDVLPLFPPGSMHRARVVLGDALVLDREVSDTKRSMIARCQTPDDHASGGNPQ